MTRPDRFDARHLGACLLPWLLLWVAAPAPLWLALGMSWFFRR